MDEAPIFSELTTSTLDPATLATLFSDIAAHTEVIEIFAKAGAESHAGSTRLTLDTAQSLLLSGKVRGIQLRYRYQGDEWWDTLINTPAGVRIVRVKQDFDGVMNA